MFHHAPAVILPKACWENSYRPVQLDLQFPPKRDPRDAGPHDSSSSFSDCLHLNNSSNLFCFSVFALQNKTFTTWKQLKTWKHAPQPTNWESKCLIWSLYEDETENLAEEKMLLRKSIWNEHLCESQNPSRTCPGHISSQKKDCEDFFALIHYFHDLMEYLCFERFISNMAGQLKWSSEGKGWLRVV